MEIGIGRGRFFEDLLRRGFQGLCLDLNRELIAEHANLERVKSRPVEFKAQSFFSLTERFDLVVAFEVLEHYAEDADCLRKWVELLQPQGTLIFSVPAHMRQWTRNDELAGHARRYERRELLEKLGACGLTVERLWCYGFPVLNLTYPLSSGLPRKSVPTVANPERDDPRMASFQKTLSSGDRRFLGLSNWLFSELFWLPWLHAQRPFLEGDSGTGYIVKCALSNRVEP